MTTTACARTGRTLLLGGSRHRRGNKNPAERGFLEADDGDRTRDPQLGKLMLYQLSYVRARPTIAPLPRPPAPRRMLRTRDGTDSGLGRG